MTASPALRTVTVSSTTLSGYAARTEVSYMNVFSIPPLSKNVTATAGYRAEQVFIRNVPLSGLTKAPRISAPRGFCIYIPFMPSLPAEQTRMRPGPSILLMTSV